MQLLTRWGRDLDPERPLPEYPRPQLVRSSYLNLNGRWEYAFVDAGTGADRSGEPPATWDGEIVVPFSPECVLSGVERQLQPDELLWYRRSNVRPPPGDRVLLNFGAVDQICTVWVDGTLVATHTGGYLPFSCEVTAALDPARADHEILVRVRDLSETGPHARGKQRLDRGRIWYTAQSGIWQTVWMEGVPSTYVDGLRILADLPQRAVLVEVDVVADGTSSRDPDVTVRLLEHDNEVGRATGPAGSQLRLDVANPRPWSPADPFLYDLEVTCGEDRVTSYAALRSFERGTDGRGRPCFLLNGEPFQHVGILDQGYWPDGLMTAPSDAAVLHDLHTIKELGFTMVRKHAKIEPLRWYHHCDQLGLIVWQDVVNGGGRYRELVTNLPARLPRWLTRRISDRRYPLFFRDDAAGREEFRSEVRASVDLLRNVAAIAVWTPFNEGWGQFDANEIAAEVSRRDPGRLVNHVSGWVDQGGGDIVSYHSYLRAFRLPRRPWDRRVPALTEYGGYSLQVPGHCLLDDPAHEEFGYRHFEDVEALAAGFSDLHERWIGPAVDRGLAATVYTQLTDVEDEVNGLLTWDREVQKIGTPVVRAALNRVRGGA